MCRECSPSRVAAEGRKGVSPPHLFLSHTPISVPRTPEASNFASILLPLLVPMVVIVPAAVTRECISRKKRRR